MKAEDITIDGSMRRPKYAQIVKSILDHIDEGKLDIGDRIPSINEISIEHLLSRETVVKAYRELKKRGIIASKHGKGYYIKNTTVKKEINVCLIFNKLSSHKKVIYDAFINTLGDEGRTDLYVYNNNFNIFKNLIESNLGHYSHYVIISHFLGGKKDVVPILDKIPDNQLLILDRMVEKAEGKFPAVYQNFHNDIYNALNEAESLLEKYKKVILVYPDYSYHSIDIKIGFEDFCQNNNLKYDVISKFNEELFESECAYIVIEESDLVSILSMIKQKDLKLTKDIGIISYNESPLKEFILDGLTVVSTDFHQMGVTAAEMILRRKTERVENPFLLIKRNSV